MELGKQKIRTGRTMIQRKFEEGGLQLASDISLKCNGFASYTSVE